MTSPEREQDGPRHASHATVEIAGYRVQRVLGTDGIATRYAALQSHPRRTVVLKVLEPESAPDGARRFRREVEALGRLQHPNVAQIFDAGECDRDGVNVPYYVMEYVAGGKNIIEHVAHRELDLPQRLKLFVKVCAAVDFGHRHKVIHRDLRPENILIDRAGEPKVIDFGIARTASPGGDSGSIQYASPEQLAETPVDIDRRCDVYALGTLLYRLAAGRMPFALDGVQPHLAAKVVRDDIPAPPSSSCPEVRRELDAIIMKALAKDRAERYGSARTLGRDVVGYLNKRPLRKPASASSGNPQSPHRGRRVLIIVAALIVVAAAVGGGLWLSRRSPEPSVDPARERVDAPVETQAVEPPTPAVTLDGHSGRVTALAFDATGGRLLSGSSDETVVLWDVDAETVLLSAHDHDRPLRLVAFSPDGRQVATIADDGSVLIVRIEGNAVAYSRRDECDAGEAAALHFGDDASRIALACGDLTLHMWSTDDRRAQTLRSSSGAFTAVTFDDAGETLVTGTAQGRVELWDAASGRRLRRLEGLFSSVAIVGFGPGEESVIAAAVDGAIMRWSRDDTTPATRIPCGLDLISSASLAGDRLICASPDALQIFDVERSAPTGPPIERDETITSVAIDADGRRYAVGGTTGDIVVKSVPGTR